MLRRRHDASEAAWQHLSVQPEAGGSHVNAIVAQAALARGDLIAARRWADDAVAATTGWHLSRALTTRARVAIAQGEPEQAERDAHDALAMRRRHRGIPGRLPTSSSASPLWPADAGSHREAARLFGAADAIRQRIGRGPLQGLRRRLPSLGGGAAKCDGRRRTLTAAWAEGAALSTEEAIAYAQRGRGERKRPTSGWASLTPTERDVVRLVSEGLANKDIATRLFVSPRTVQTHLTHVYTKLGLTSRVQLAQEAARHA